MSYFCQEELFKSEKKHYNSVYLGIKGSLRQGSIPSKPRSRSVPDVMVLNSQPLSGLLINTNVFQGASYGIFPCRSVPNNNIKKQPATLSK